MMLWRGGIRMTSGFRGVRSACLSGFSSIAVAGTGGGVADGSDSEASGSPVVRELLAGGHDKVKLGATDVDGIMRGKYVSLAKFAGCEEKGLGFCNVIFGWDMNDELYDNAKYTGWHTGYPDVQARVDSSTFCYLPWEAEGDRLGVCPRNLLKTVTERLEGKEFLLGPEFEFYCFQEDTRSASGKGHAIDRLTPLSPGNFGYSNLRTGQNSEFLTDLFSSMRSADVHIEGFHTETGPGVLEVALQFGPALQAADGAALFKYGSKVLGHQYGVMPCFMAKPYEKLPGCSGHVHQSMVNKDTGENEFYDPDGDFSMSQKMRQFVAGQLHLMPALTALYCPTINSYKRLVEGYWAPVQATWGVENRTTSIRVIPGGKGATRVETRLAGADTNPYLCYAAALASGIYGIENELDLDEFPAIIGTQKVEESKKQERLPRNLMEACEKLNASAAAREVLGDEFVDHFVSSREWEWRQFQTSVTDWELKRYMEII